MGLSPQEDRDGWKRLGWGGVDGAMVLGKCSFSESRDV